MMLLQYMIVFLTLFHGCLCITRRYYIAAEDYEWDYAPSRSNLITNTPIQENTIEAEYLMNGPNRIGNKYGKSGFFEYTNDSFTEQKQKSSWQGLLGPIIRAEVGDKIELLFKNLASRPYSLHTHGVLYDKSSEGAKYEDKTTAKERLDDSVPPGSNHTYHFVVDEISGPAEGDPNCVAWPYHSHISSPSGTNTGVVGALVLCRKGTLDANGERIDVDKDVVLLVTVIDENLSYHIEDNIQKYCTDPNSVDPEDEAFQESNKMHSINGYVYGNLPVLEMCQGERIAWHVFSLGTETDLHTLLFHGNIMNILNHRRDAFFMSPGVFLTGEMEVDNPGTWLMRSEVNVHYKAGTSALYKVDSSCAKQDATPDEPIKQTRQYFIQAEEIIWDYAPSGMDLAFMKSLTDPDSISKLFFATDGGQIGGKYKKAHYIAYTDDTFSSPVVRTNEETHLGLLGPVIRAEVGDEILVNFRNNASREYSIFSHGVMYDKANEGVGYADNADTEGPDKADDAVAPGQNYTYRWTIPESYAPTDADPDCVTWLYYSNVDSERDVYSGLVGPLLVCKPDTLDETGRQKDVLEYHLYMMVIDENESWYNDDNIEMFSSLTVDAFKANEEIAEFNKKYVINGYSYANVPGLNYICLGKDVTWHMSALGTDIDQHTVHFRGHTVTFNGRHVDTIILAPGISATARMEPLKTGTWGIECMTNSHYNSGMKTLYTVNDTCSDATETPRYAEKKRTFYIAAEEIEWDFAENKFDFMKNMSLLDAESDGFVFVKQEGPFIGSVYKKVVYRQYTSDSFKTQTTRDPSQQHLGILGPIIRAEVGDEIEVVFKNMASRNYSVYLHGLMYNEKDPNQRHGQFAQPNQMLTYTWTVTKESGPGKGDKDCVLYAYYSDVDRVQDTHSGLVGPLVICSKGTLGKSGSRMDVDREFVLIFNVFDENQSWYLDENIQTYSPDPNAVDKSDGEFEESNLMHGINGYLFGNLKHLEMYLDETVEWYLISLGEEVDIHTVHFHGQSVIYQQYTQHRIDVIEMFPGVFSTVQMKLKRAGHWLLHCHVNDHLLGGMSTTYEVKEGSPGGQMQLTSCPVTVLTSVFVVLMHVAMQIL